MFSRHVTARLPRYVDGDLPPADTRAVDAHLAGCDDCRRHLEEIRFAARLVRQLAVARAPESVWNGIDSALAQPAPQRMAMPGLRWASVFALLLVAAGAGAFWWNRNPPSLPWQVETLTNGRGTMRMAAGDVIDTGQGSRMRIRVGDIGIVDVEPGTRVRLGELRPAEFRLALDRGTISAQITAPPRLFIVDTPASTVVDLGCAYRVTVADDGAGELHMTEGWAAVEWQGRESLVPAGAVCRTRPSIGPGMPYFEDATDALTTAVEAFDFKDGGAAAVDVILREARVRDTLTLWHLLSRVEADARGRVYDRIAELTPAPAGVSRERALQLDGETLRLLREELAWKW